MTRLIRGAPPITLTLNPVLPCGCTHHNALTCIAEHEHTTRFNAMMTYANGDEDGGCMCPCHRDQATRQPVSRIAWQRIYEDEQARLVRQEKRKASAS